MAVERGEKSVRTLRVGTARKSFYVRTLIAALALAAMSAVSSIAAPDAAAAEPEKFGDWILRCESPGDGKSEICYLHQTLNYSKGNVSGMLLDIKIGALGEGKDLFALIMLPLGVNFQSGAIIGADAGESTSLTIQTCTKEGCRSTAKISNDLLWGFRKGNILKVGFVPFGGKQTVVVEASLKGFSAAFRALRSR